MTTETYRLGDELERLGARLDELAARADQADSNSAIAAVHQIADEVETRGEGVNALITKYGEDAEVTVRALSAGDYAEIDDRVEAKQVQSDLPGSKRGYRRNVVAATGLVDAPFLDEDTGEDEDGPSLEKCLPAVADLKGKGPSKWLKARVDDASTVDEGNFKSFDERLAEQSQTD
jgi:predicted transcriptional regulator